MTQAPATPELVEMLRDNTWRFEEEVSDTLVRWQGEREEAADALEAQQARIAEPVADEVCWRCRGERCIQEGSPEAWNYADCDECKGTGRLSPSPIREPEISKASIMAVLDEKIFLRALSKPEMGDGFSEGYGVFGLEEAADAILNLAPVGGRGEVSASDRAFVRHLIREMRSAIADDPNDATITTGPLDPDILERVLNVALGAQEQGGMK